ncbi:MAG: ABC transporter ATP-binding protein [Polyangiaceae bacterium]|nr:ABC transporter ATP-binding protein [Polyangiaceae bacterium]
MSPKERSPDGLTAEAASNAQVLLRLLKLAWRHRVRCLLVLSLQSLLLLLGVWGLSFGGIGVDVIRHHLQAGAPLPRWPLGLAPPASLDTWHTLLALSGLILAMALFRGCLTYVYSIQAGKLVHMDVVPAVRADVYAKLQRLSFRFFDAHASGSIINRVTRDVQLLRSFVDGVVIQGVIMALSLLLYAAYMFLTHPGLTAASLILSPVLAIITNRFSKWAQPEYAKNRKLVDDMVLRIAEGTKGIHVLKVFGQERKEHERFVERNLAVKEQQTAIFRAVSVYGPSVQFLSQLNVAVLLGYGGWLVCEKELTLGSLIVFTGLLQQFGVQVRTMATVVDVLQQSLSGARRVFEVLDAQVEVQSPSAPVRPSRIQGALKFENVSFAFGPEQAALNDITFELKPGQCVAILGGTGSGKSTLLSLIPRFYDPTAGRVLLDGVDLRSLDLDILRRNVGVVFQESLLFSATVAENIAFGKPDASQGDIERAAKVARVHDFIMSLPEGYNTLLQEAATNLSGGQKQRIAIARAILLEPAILLLDDPTASVDPDTEHEVLEAVDSATANRTTFIVAHRLSTLRRADIILVLKDGRIVQRGTHAELMEQSGLYSRTARLQTGDFDDLGLLASGGIS